MTFDNIDRSVIRKQFAGLLSDALVGTNKPVTVVYDYQVGDFRGKSPVIIVTGSGSERAKPYAQSESVIYLDVHTFVLYALKPLNLDVDVEADTEVVIELSDTSMFEVGSVVVLEDDAHNETATVTTIDPDEFITLDEVEVSFTSPYLHYWTESQSEDMIDLLEKMISDVIGEANGADYWLACEQSDRSDIDVVEVGGDAYRHEWIAVKFTISDVEE